MSGKQAIPFEYALARPEARQAYIDQRVASVLGSRVHDHVSRFVYNHDGSLIKPAMDATCAVVVSDPRFFAYVRKELQTFDVMDEAVGEYMNDPRFVRFDDRERNDRIEEFLISESGIREIVAKMEKEAGHDFDCGRNFAGTIQNPFEIGTGVKSEIILTGKIFENMTRGTLYGPATLEPTPVDIDAALLHENTHAEDHAYGIRVVHPSGKVMTIDQTNIHDINPQVLSGVREARAYRVMLERTRRANERPSVRVRGFHPAYLRTLICFDGQMREFRADLQGFDALNTHLWEAQRKKLEPFFAEVDSVLDKVGVPY